MKLKYKIEAFKKLESDIDEAISEIHGNCLKREGSNELYDEWWLGDNGNIIIDCIIEDSDYMTTQYCIPLDIFSNLETKEDYEKYLESLKPKKPWEQTEIFEIIKNIEENT